jgi:hypothetical protein
MHRSPRTARRARLKTTAAVVLGMLSPAAAADAQAAGVGGVTAGSVASFSTCTHSVSGSAYTLSSLQGNGVWARAWVYDYATGRWGLSGWVPADGITRFAVGATTPYRYAYVVFARYVGGWRYAAEWTDISGDLDNGFCR